ncbi:MAG: lamin tail domain-containing protein, partial [Salinibacterium sp.]|nr:lamin tail domain-containing protein [Salinibacterium sp.]
MSHTPRKSLKSAFASLLGLVLVAAPLAAIPAQANTAGTGVVINELYMNGGSSGASYVNKFVELYNPTAVDIPLSGMSLQYRSRTGTGDPTSVAALTGVIPAHGTYLVGGGSNAGNGAALPTPDQSDNTLNFAGAGGLVILANQTTALNPGTGDVAGAAGVIDLVGYGTANSYETAAAPAASVSTSINRTNGADTDDNSADFSAAAPTPTPSGYVPP